MIMKRIFITLIVAALCLASIQTSAQQSATSSKAVNSKISEVTLFLDGAEILREASADLPKGISFVKFENLSGSIIRNSVQFTSEKNITILSVTLRNNFLGKSDKSEELIKLEKSLEEVEGKIATESANLSVIIEDMDFLRANREITGKNATLTIASLQQISEYYSKSISSLKMKEIAKKMIVNNLTAQKDSLTRQIDIMKRENYQPAGEVIVKVNTTTAGKYNMKLTYVSSNASWRPVYDLRAESIEKPLTLNYKANIFQKTGENWDSVTLRLSSANPNLSGVVPVITPYYLRYPEVIAYGRGVMKKDMMLAEESVAFNALEARESVAPPSAMVMEERQTSVEFKVNERYTIKSDGEKHTVDLTSYEMPALYKYYAVPKLDKDAFLLARVPDRERYNLLPGEASIFFEGRYIGTTSISTETVSDTLDFSLGRDKGISISREQVTDFTSRRLIGSKREDAEGWKIVVRNNKNVAIDIEIKDQLPLSTNEEIEVSAQNISGGNLDPLTGEISWRFSLLPAVTKQIDLNYIIKYPKNKTIIK
jgi:uncharacterized protein (TIGR02231 family)